MFVSADQLLVHALGDYVLQSDASATRKTSSSFWAFVHVVTYTIPFLMLTTSPLALAVIFGTHFVIDRWRLARFVCWAKNAVGGSYSPWSECTATGYHKDRPAWLAVWLMIITDNIMHVTINAAAIHWL
jgi:hypothetical protein